MAIRKKEQYIALALMIPLGQSIAFPLSLCRSY